jgi:HNH endonuclease
MAGSRLSYTEEEARAAIAASKSWAESLRYLGLCPTGGAWRILKKYARIWGVSTDHFDPEAARVANLRRRQRSLSEMLVENSPCARKDVKRRLLAEGMKEPVCEMCGQDEMWHGRPMSMILDHINGVRDDHRLENLRMLCPNCAATLDTHCGRRNRIQRARRECQRCGKSLTPSYALREAARGDRGDELRRRRPQVRRFRQRRSQVGAFYERQHEREAAEREAVGRLDCVRVAA